MDEITENDLTPLINNQNKTIINMKIKQVYAKLEKDLISIFDCFKVNFRDKQLNDLNDLNGNNKL